MSTLVALGDSFSCGEGVGVRVPLAHTWSAVLARHLGLAAVSLAAPGARVRDLRTRQLPNVPDAEVGTVLVGLNDVCRGTLDREALADDLHTVVHGLACRVDVVMLARLHDPAALLWLPKRLRTLVNERTDAVNSAVDVAAQCCPRVLVLDLARIDALRLRCSWAPDRVHPTAFGHRAVAAAAAEQMHASGRSVAPLDVPPQTRGASTARHLLWLAAYGTPYLARNAKVFATPLAEGLRRAG